MLTGLPGMSCMFRLSLRTSSGLETVILLPSQNNGNRLKMRFHLLKSVVILAMLAYSTLADSSFHTAEAYGHSCLQQASAMKMQRQTLTCGWLALHTLCNQAHEVQPGSNPHH